jgi:hypothetical protein
MAADPVWKRFQYGVIVAGDLAKAPSDGGGPESGPVV